MAAREGAIPTVTDAGWETGAGAGVMPNVVGQTTTGTRDPVVVAIAGPPAAGTRATARPTATASAPSPNGPPLRVVVTGR